MQIIQGFAPIMSIVHRVMEFTKELLPFRLAAIGVEWFWKLWAVSCSFLSFCFGSWFDLTVEKVNNTAVTDVLQSIGLRAVRISVFGSADIADWRLL